MSAVQNSHVSAIFWSRGSPRRIESYNPPTGMIVAHSLSSYSTGPHGFPTSRHFHTFVSWKCFSPIRLDPFETLFHTLNKKN